MFKMQEQTGLETQCSFRREHSIKTARSVTPDYFWCSHRHLSVHVTMVLPHTTKVTGESLVEIKKAVGDSQEIQ